VLEDRTLPSVLTTAILFSTDTTGSESGGQIWDTYPGGFYNLWFAPGSPGGSPNGLTSPFINGPADAQASINIPLQPGPNIFTIFGAPGGSTGFQGMNLAFNGHTSPDISVKAATRTDSTIPAFSANNAPSTMSVDNSGTRVPGAGTLTFNDGGTPITLIDFFWATPTVFGVDRVSRPPNDIGGGTAVPDGIPDFVGSFTLVLGAQTNLAIAGFPSPTTAGVAQSFTVTALDSFGNIANGYTGTVHFTSTDTKSLLPANYSFTASDSGVHSFSATLETAGTQAITATDTVTMTITGSESGITVNPAAATHLIVGAPASSTAGTAFSITVSALDPYGNTATGYTGTDHFSSSDKKAALPADYTFTGGDGGVHIFRNGVALVTAGSQTVSATDTVTATITGKSSTIKVSAAALNHLKVKAVTSSTAGVAFSITVVAQDAYNNTVTTYIGTVHFTSTDSQAVLPADYTFISANKGVHIFSGVTLKTAGTQTVTATDTVTATLKGSAGIAVKPGQASTLSFTAPSSVSAGVAFTFTVTALDAYGNVATGYVGTVHFSSSDAAASLPENFTFLSTDAGIETFVAIFNTTGSQSLTANDTLTPSIIGTDLNIQVA
jgi:hypothetical protein